MKKVHEAFLWILVISLVITATCALVDLISNDEYIQDLCRGVYTGSIGTIITIFIIDILLQSLQREEALSDAKKRLLRSHEVLEIHIKNYEEAARNLATPIGVGNSQPKGKLAPNFPFSNLHDLFMPSLSLIEGSMITKIEQYIKRMHRMRDMIQNTLYNVDLTFFPEVSSLLIDYLQHMENYDPSQGIMEEKNAMLGNRRAADYVKEYIKSCEKPPGYNPSNAFNKYQLLYDMINYQLKFISQYRALIDKATA